MTDYASHNVRTGRVKFYDARVNRFGFIVDDAGGPDIFFHENVLGRAGIHHVSPGQRVRCFVEGDRKGNRLRAIQIEFLGEKRPTNGKPAAHPIRGNEIRALRATVTPVSNT
jgi:CspA family cold shock protein